MGAIWEDGGGRVLYPFLLRDLSTLATIGDAASGLFDISTAYGYGGPLVDAPADERRCVARFRTDFDAWCRRSAVVSEFIRFHPLLETDRGLEALVEVVPLSETVWCRVDGSSDDLLSGMEAAHRRNLRKAQRAGLVVRVETETEALSRFQQLYTATMSRRRASDGYFFDDAYFLAFRELLGDRQALLGVRLGDEMVAGGLLMRMGRFAHYHLGGSSAAHLHLRPNNLFFFEAMLWAKRNGAEVLHLGGGYRPDDELLRFKRGLGRGRAAFAIGRVTHLPREYERLSDLHRRAVGEVDHGFFPAYRAAAAAAS
jgi:hypothetical protein